MQSGNIWSGFSAQTFQSVCHAKFHERSGDDKEEIWSDALLWYTMKGVITALYTQCGSQLIHSAGAVWSLCNYWARLLKNREYSLPKRNTTLISTFILVPLGHWPWHSRVLMILLWKSCRTPGSLTYTLPQKKCNFQDLCCCHTNRRLGWHQLGPLIEWHWTMLIYPCCAVTWA